MQAVAFLTKPRQNRHARHFPFGRCRHKTNKMQRSPAVPIVASTDWVVAEMLTHDYIWRGAGLSCDEAREALLAAWTQHRSRVLAELPQLAASLPEAAQMPQHFKIRYLVFERGAGYRDNTRLV
jgi:hypothetical protein